MAEKLRIQTLNNISPLGLSRQKMVQLIQAAGRVPVERDALYNELRIYADGQRPMNNSQSPTQAHRH